MNNGPDTTLIIVWSVLLLAGVGFAYLLHWLGKHYGRHDDQGNHR